MLPIKHASHNGKQNEKQNARGGARCAIEDTKTVKARPRNDMVDCSVPGRSSIARRPKCVPCIVYCRNPSNSARPGCESLLVHHSRKNRHQPEIATPRISF